MIDSLLVKASLLILRGPVFESMEWELGIKKHCVKNGLENTCMKPTVVLKRQQGKLNCSLVASRNFFVRQDLLLHRKIYQKVDN